jgi:hypothetical protein
MSGEFDFDGWVQFTKRSLAENPPGLAGVEDEEEARNLARYGAKSRVWSAAPYKIAKLLDSARLLIEIVDGEREKNRELATQNERLAETGLALSKFVLRAHDERWITTHEMDVLFDLAHDPETLRRLTDE